MNTTHQFRTLGRFVMPALMTIAALLWAPTVFADPTPVVEVITASPSYISNDGTTLLSWTAGAATGDDLYFACPAGVTVTANDTSFPCNTRESYSGNVSDSGDFVITNVSGERQTLAITAYPKDSNGVDYDAGAMSTSLIVGPSMNPITGFSLSAASASSGSPLTLSWSSVDTPGVNFEFDCNANVRILISSTSTEGLPCGGTAAFSPDLPQSGTTTVIVQDLSASPQSINVHAVPLIAAGLYDITHALSASLTVSPTSAQMQPTATSFTSSSPSVASGIPFTLTWATQNAAGANIEFICNSYSITPELVSGTTTMPVPCNAPAFAPALAASGTTSVEIITGNYSAQNIGLELLPEGSDGTYYASGARTITLPIVAAGSLAAVTQQAPVSVTMNATSSANVIASTLPHYEFTLALHRGSQNADVTALQQYLALDPTIYPLGLVTGYFGAATQAAVESFQVKYDIASQGVAGYGLVGPKTRAELNTLQ